MDTPWVEERRYGLLGSFCSSLCNSISSCLHFFCCCWFTQDCDDCLPGHLRSEPGSYAPRPFGPCFDHPRPNDSIVGPDPAPLVGSPGGPPSIFIVYCSLYFCCCCWFIQDCLPGLGQAGHYRSEPGSYAPLPFGPSFDHPRPTDPLVGPGPAPPHFGSPGGPPGVPGPLAGPPGEDPYMFEPPGPPVPPGPPHY